MDPADNQRAFMQRLFGAIARRYDRFNAVVSLTLDRRWRARVVAEGLQAGSRHNLRVLDVCTGTGELALGFAAAVNGSSRVVGVDLSAPMLALAQQKGVRRAAKVAWLRGDAVRLPFPDGQFDCVTIGFSTRNVPDLRMACAEMRRVLKSGGRLLILEAGKPQSLLMQIGYYAYLYTVMPLVGTIICGAWWPFQYLRRSIQRFLTPPAFVALLRDVGFATEHHPLHGGITDLFIATKT